MFRALAPLALVLPLLAAPAAPPTLRLPDNARPVSCALELTVKPDQEAFDGVIGIQTRLKQASDLIWLHASGLTILEAAYTPEGGQPIHAAARQSGADFLGLSLDHAVPAGQGLLRIRFSGPMSRKSTEGLFTQQDEGHWYAFSQFESTYARRAFPCFDEPGCKVPWQVTLHVPRQDVALSNAPMASEQDEAHGMKAVRFKPTRPLPSYLVALAVGPFDLLDAGKAGRNGTPVRIAVAKGHGAEASYALEAVPRLLGLLEDYFGIPYPYEKLDSVVIPLTVTFGAMENAGLITYAKSILLARPEDQSIRFKRACASVAAHEMAHQWTGDLVTMGWWNDVWLNEAFATWMAAKVVDTWQPGWDVPVDDVLERERAIRADSLLSARMIHQPITSQDDIENAFDAITYTKGAAVLSMFESFMGPVRFQRGVHQYLTRHAYGNATTHDFLASLGAQDARIPAAFGTFLDQSGLPLLKVGLKARGRGSIVTLEQRRFLPVGSHAPAAQRWRIPVTLRCASHGKVRTRRVLVQGSRLEVPLPVAPGDLDYLLVNDGLKGYYRSLYPGALLTRLLKDDRTLTVAERIGVTADLDGAAKAGEASKAEALALVPRLAADRDAHVVAAAAELTRSVGAHLVAEASRPGYARFIQQCFGVRARSLGFIAKAGEDESTRLLRQTLVPLVALDGGDLELRAQAREGVLLWLRDRKALDADVAPFALVLAAHYGDRALFDQLLAAAKASPDQTEQEHLLTALGSFFDPELQRAGLATLLTQAFDPRMGTSIFWAGLEEPRTQPLVLAFVERNFDALMARLPKEYGIYLPLVAAPSCDEASRREAEAFFRPRVTAFPGGPRMLAQALEGIQLCQAQKTAQSPSVAAFLAKY